VSWPLIACLSTLWSISPNLSLSHGIQLLMTTLVAFLICVQLRLHQFITIFFCALLAAAIVTLGTELLSLNVVTGTGWYGSFPHKNIMGSAMSLLVITSLCLFLQGQWRAVSLFAVGLGLFLIAKSNSAAAVLSLAMTLAALPFAYAFVRDRTTFTIVLGSALICGAVGALGLYAAMIIVGIDPIDIVLSSVGRERTLTGRTLLWDLAEAAIQSRPWLGFGYKAYWTNIPAEMRDLVSVVGGVFHFHNNYLDVAVAFGFIGPILLALGVLTGLARSLRMLLAGTEPIDAWPFLIVVMIVILTFVENPLVWNHNMWHVLFVAVAVIRK
jgi:O-antigen ligase